MCYVGHDYQDCDEHFMTLWTMDYIHSCAVPCGQLCIRCILRYVRALTNREKEDVVYCVNLNVFYLSRMSGLFGDLCLCQTAACRRGCDPDHSLGDDCCAARRKLYDRRGLASLSVFQATWNSSWSRSPLGNLTCP